MKPMKLFTALLGIAILAALAGALPIDNVAVAMQNSGTDTSNNTEAQKVEPSHIYFDRQFYSIGQKGTVTIIDKNLDRRPDAIDSYRPVKGFVSLEINKREVSDDFVGKFFRTSFRETGPNTGIFKALLKIPSTDDMGVSIKGKALTIRYFDIHNRVIWQDTATVL